MLTHHNDTLDCYCSPLWLHHCREARSSVSDRTYCSVVRLLMTVELTFFFLLQKVPLTLLFGVLLLALLSFCSEAISQSSSVIFFPRFQSSVAIGLSKLPQRKKSKVINRVFCNSIQYTSLLHVMKEVEN
jgi:hypothetical protein